MLDQASFMRQYALGNVPKSLLFSLMALGYRLTRTRFIFTLRMKQHVFILEYCGGYSHVSFQPPHLRSRWVEPLLAKQRFQLKRTLIIRL